jgi:hypothetical protein
LGTLKGTARAEGTDDEVAGEPDARRREERSGEADAGERGFGA